MSHSGYTTIERQAGRVAELERENGALQAENRALAARTAAQDEEAIGELFPSRWRALAPWLLGLLAIVAAAVLLGWPR